ncbi:MAG: superoxide dismutase [Alphaproteobacteria bacterium]|nr:superoxide dismutase [Rickettsiales bacterium]
MSFKLQDLPYSISALEPYMSKQTVSYHYKKHHTGYLNNLNKLIANTEYAEMPLTKVIQDSYKYKANRSIFNNAAQFYNHNMFWLSMSPENSRQPNDKLLKLINDSFGSMEDCIGNFSKLAISQFGSGWAWICLDPKTLKLNMTQTSNAENPLTEGLIPLLTIDVWEHAYYLDYQNLRAKYIETFCKELLNWNLVSIKIEEYL